MGIASSGKNGRAMERRRVAVLYLAGMLCPGAGHLLIGHVRKGVLFLFAAASHLAILGMALNHGRLWGADAAGFRASALLLCGLSLAVWVVGLHDLARELRNRKRERAEGYWARVKRRSVKDPRCVAGALLVVGLVYVALFAPFFSPYPPLSMRFGAFLPPSTTHLFGTDNFGRDVLSRIVYGSRVAMGIAAPATLLNMLLGGFLGLVSGFFGGRVDSAIMRVLEVLGSIPYLIIALVILNAFGSTTWNLIWTIGFLSLIYPARIIRSEVLATKSEGYIESCKAIGASVWRVILRHVLPNAFTSLLVVATMQVGRNIIYIASLSFLGFGIRPPSPDWGAMLQEGRDFLRAAPWMSVFPGVFIVLSVFTFNILGDGLRDTMDPRLG
jgi:peptide/nickel transport system permease protein